MPYFIKHLELDPDKTENIMNEEKEFFEKAAIQALGVETYRKKCFRFRPEIIRVNYLL